VPEFDTIETIGHSVIQHGPCNQRIYLMKAHADDLPGLMDQLDALAQERGYTKIFVKVPAPMEGDFIARQYLPEASIPRYYRGETDAIFLGKFLSPERAQERHAEEVARNLELAAAKAGQGLSATPLKGLEGIEIFETTPGDAETMAEIYREVFETYPFPIHDPEYLRETMRTHVRYFGVREGGRVVALASAEMDHEALSVEMTDFATLPSQQGRGFAVALLQAMEAAMREGPMRTAFTIARALSPGMNITFAKLGYEHSGTLTNNTDICGRIESMNIWHRSLD
jgi:beta-lysine N6-acetyltransferase